MDSTQVYAPITESSRLAALFAGALSNAGYFDDIELSYYVENLALFQAAYEFWQSLGNPNGLADNWTPFIEGYAALIGS